VWNNEKNGEAPNRTTSEGRDVWIALRTENKICRTFTEDRKFESIQQKASGIQKASTKVNSIIQYPGIVGENGNV
jgi:hypothetical protein